MMPILKCSILFYDYYASLNIAFTSGLISGRTVNGKLVSLFERREMDPTE